MILLLLNIGIPGWIEQVNFVFLTLLDLLDFPPRQRFPPLTQPSALCSLICLLLDGWTQSKNSHQTRPVDWQFLFIASKSQYFQRCGLQLLLLVGWAHCRRVFGWEDPRLGSPRLRIPANADRFRSAALRQYFDDAIPKTLPRLIVDCFDTCLIAAHTQIIHQLGNMVVSTYDLYRYYNSLKQIPILIDPIIFRMHSTPEAPEVQMHESTLARLSSCEAYSRNEIQVVCRVVLREARVFYISETPHELQTLPKANKFFLISREDSRWQAAYLSRKEDGGWVVQSQRCSGAFQQLLRQQLGQVQFLIPKYLLKMPNRKEDSGPVALYNIKRMSDVIVKKSPIQEPLTDIASIRTHLHILVVKTPIKEALEGLKLKKEESESIGRRLEQTLGFKKELSDPLQKYQQELQDYLAKTDKCKSQEEIKKIDVKEMEQRKQSFLDAAQKVLPDKRNPESQVNALPDNKQLQPQPYFDHLTSILRFLKGIRSTEESKKLIRLIAERFNIKPEPLQELVFCQPLKIPNPPQPKQPLNLLEQISKMPQLPVRLDKDPDIRSPEELVLEMTDLLNEPEFLKDHLVEAYLRDLETVKSNYSSTWALKSKEDIYGWSTAQKAPDQLQLLAAMDRANELVTGYPLRSAQKLAYLCFLRSKPNFGKILQISTGEGKTVIVSLMAVMKALQGHPVDVITSNEVLAEQGVQQRRNFYSLFGLTVATNNKDTDQQEENTKLRPRECYKCNIVYGNISSFQFDYLNDEFEERGTRAGRQYGWVILDEVDSIVIDNGGYVAKMAEPFPGMDYLRYVYIKIWLELSKVEQQQTSEDSWLSKELSKFAGSLKESPLSPQEKQQQYELYCRKLESETANRIELLITTSIQKYIENNRLIPVHIRPFARSMVRRWLASATAAKHVYNENEQYVLKKKDGEMRVTPVDYLNTGVTLNNTVWCDGLHQFVELKHNLRLSTESLTTSFVSNVGYIALYGNRIFGMTGTLGSEAEQQVLAKVYKVEFGTLPPYKPKRMAMEENIVVRDYCWLELVILQIFHTVESERSVLVVCKTIRELEELTKGVEAYTKMTGTQSRKVRIYRDEECSDVVHESVDTREIILATNISGRGTDFHTTEQLERKGGLHVILAFLPANQRVQDQALGRTGRQGNQGSGQLLLKQSDLQEVGLSVGDWLTFEQIFARRDELEANRLENIRTTKLLEIKAKDKLFGRFVSLMRDFRKRNTDKFGKGFLIKDLKECWAFWLHQQNFEHISEEGLDNQVTKYFEGFLQRAQPILNGAISFSCFNAVAQAETFLQNRKVNEARDSLMLAVKLAGDGMGHLFPIYTKLFEVQIESGGQLMERFKQAVAKIFFVDSLVEKNVKYKQLAANWLKKAKQDIERVIKCLREQVLSPAATESAPEEQPRIQPILCSSGCPNALLTQLNSLLLTYNLFRNHLESLGQSLLDSTCGVMINQRIPDYFLNLKPTPLEEDLVALKQQVQPSELECLGEIGMRVVYSLREVHDASKEVILGAQIQIGSGIAVLLSGIAFPPAIPFTGPIAGALISEGICDIAIELISQGNSGFDKAAYIKGKVISYGISLVTMGVGAIMSSVSIMNKAISACRKMAEWLRACKYLKSACEKLAKVFDRLGAYFTRMRDLAVFAKLSQTEKLSHMKGLLSANNLAAFQELGGMAVLNNLKHLQAVGKLDVVCRVALLKTAFMGVAKLTTKNLALMAANKLVEMGLQGLLGLVAGWVLGQVGNSVKQCFSADKVKFRELKDIQLQIAELSSCDEWGQLLEASRFVATEIASLAGSWRVKVSLIMVDSIATWRRLCSLIEQTCRLLLKQLPESKLENTPEKIGAAQELVSVHLTTSINSIIVSTAGTYINKFVVSPVVNKIETALSKDKVGTIEEIQREIDLIEVEDAANVLKVPPNADIETIRGQYKKMARILHPDKNIGDPNAEENFKRLKKAYDILMNACQPKVVVPAMPLSIGGIVQTPSPTPDIYRQPANSANVQRIANKLQVQILIERDNGELVRFGSSRNNNRVIRLAYSPPSVDNLVGHYQLPEQIRAELRSAGRPTQLEHNVNDCFYEAVALHLPLLDVQPLQPQNLRAIAEEGLMAWATDRFIRAGDRRLANAVTQSMWCKVKGGLLVGGAGGRKPGPLTDVLPIPKNEIQQKMLRNQEAFLNNTMDKALPIHISMRMDFPVALAQHLVLNNYLDVQPIVKALFQNDKILGRRVHRSKPLGVPTNTVQNLNKMKGNVKLKDMSHLDGAHIIGFHLANLPRGRPGRTLECFIGRVNPMPKAGNVSFERVLDVELCDLTKKVLLEFKGDAAKKRKIKKIIESKKKGKACRGLENQIRKDVVKAFSAQKTHIVNCVKAHSQERGVTRNLYGMKTVKFLEHYKFTDKKDFHIEDNILPDP